MLSSYSVYWLLWGYSRYMYTTSMSPLVYVYMQFLCMDPYVYFVYCFGQVVFI